MQNQTIVGIDVSSATLDICIMDSKGYHSFAISNDVQSISTFFSNYNQSLIIGMENTGRYNWALYQVLKGMTHSVFVISPLHLKRAWG
jgi:transposase